MIWDCHKCNKIWREQEENYNNNHNKNINFNWKDKIWVERYYKWNK